MTELDRLPPDQRAVLSLVLDRGKGYGEVAEMLGIPESVVRDRAHAALDALAGERAYAGGRGAAGDTSAAAPGAPAARGRVGALGYAPGPRPRDARTPLGPPSSRLGGALLLGGIVAVVAVAVVSITSGGGGKGSSRRSATTPSGGATSTSNAGKPTLNKTIALTPLDPTLKARGTAYVLSEGERHAFYVTAQSLPTPSGFFYAVWLYNSPSSSAPLGRAPTVGAGGRMEGGGPLPTNASLYHQLIVTRESSTHPRYPGPIVLRGTFALR